MTLRRDPAVGALMYDLPSTSSQIFMQADRGMRQALAGWFNRITEYAKDPLARPTAWTHVRDQGKADAEAVIGRAAEAVRLYRTQLRAQAVEHIEGKRKVHPWVLDANRDVVRWLREKGADRYEVILAALSSLDKDPSDREAFEVIRAVAEAPGVIRAEITGPVIGEERIRRAYWQGIAPDDLKVLEENDAVAETLEKNVAAAQSWFREVSSAGEEKLLEMDKIRTIAAGAEEAVRDALNERHSQR